MKRPLLIVLLAAAVGLAGWAVAQPPAAGREDPPVRLKRKKRAGQEQPPPKPTKPKLDEEPDPAEEPKKPQDPPKPKLDEEERLDPKDDLKLPADGRDEKETLERIARNARTSEDRLGHRELGEGTRSLQGEILKDIDSLLERAKNQGDQDNQNNPPPQDTQNPNDQDKQGGQSASGGSQRQRQSASQQRRQRRQSARRRDRGQQGNDSARNQQNPGQGDNPGGGGPDAPAAKDKPTDRAFDLWGHLPEKVRAQMYKEMEQKFMDKYDDLTKQYYRIIAEKSRRKK